MLTREELEKRKGKRRFKTYPIGDGEARFGSMDGRARRQWRNFARTDDGKVDHEKLQYSDDVLIALSLVDADSNPLYSVAEALKGCFDDYDSPDLQAMVDAAVDINGLGGSTPGVDKTLKNSETTQS